MKFSKKIKFLKNLTVYDNIKSFIFLIIFGTFFWKIDLLHNQVIYTNLILIFISIFLFEITKKKIFLFGFLFVYFLNEILYLLFNFDLYPSESRTELVYSLGNIADNILGHSAENSVMHIDSNLTESIFKSKKCISSKEGEKNRFDLFISLLNIKKGDSVLDCGCGRGGFVSYLRNKGINAYGITIAIEQYNNNIKKHGNYFYHGDYTKFHKHLENKFDHIILPGSLEHPFGGNALKISSYKNKYEKMSEMFSMFKKYFKKDSTGKNILTTCLHQPDWISQGSKYPSLNNFRNKVIGYFTERMFGGLYPTYEDYSVKDSFLKADYKIVNELDRTWDYYYSSYCDINHFGNPYNINPLYCILGFPFNQFSFHTWVYWKYGMWMWMFSNRLHKRRDGNEKICDPNKSCDLYFEKDINKRPVSLLYTIATCK